MMLNYISHKQHIHNGNLMELVQSFGLLSQAYADDQSPCSLSESSPIRSAGKTGRKAGKTRRQSSKTKRQERKTRTQASKTMRQASKTRSLPIFSKTTYHVTSDNETQTTISLDC